MITKVRQGKANTHESQQAGMRRLSCLQLSCLLLVMPGLLTAQDDAEDLVQIPASEQVAVELVEEITVRLPDSEQLAQALATPASRDHALLDLAVAAHLLQQAQNREDITPATLAQMFLDDRGWLQRLVELHGWVQPRSSVLDAAAWLVLEELQQHALEDQALAFPGGMSRDALLYQVFQRSGQQLAVINLPALLLSLEADALGLWEKFLQLANPGEETDSAWQAVETTWLGGYARFQADETGDSLADDVILVTDLPRAMSELAKQSVAVSAPDNHLLVRLRYSLLKQARAQEESQDKIGPAVVADTLYIASLLDGLQDARYFEFVQGLVALAAGWLDGPTGIEDEFSLAAWLVEELPVISAQYASAFADTDQGLNDAVAAVYEVLQVVVNSPVSEGGDTGPGHAGLRTMLSDAVAQLALLVPDMVYYFDVPVRGRIIEDVDICISIAANRDDDGQPSMSRSQFDGCMEALLQLADTEIRTLELSGNMNGPFTDEALRRELSVPPWQRINYGVGYLLERYSSACPKPDAALPNPLEWAVLATTMTWLAEHAPGFFHSEENESRVSRMRTIGELLMLELKEQSNCLAAEASGDNDMVSRITRDYEQALRELNQGIRRAEDDFRAASLKPGADVSLAEDALQRTAYRPDDLLIRPCDAQAVCDMGGDLSTTRALIGLFPDQYLVADQTGMGRIEICYQNMAWVQRRSELVRADDENVANYFGRLGFDLLGRYVENGQSSDVFGFRFTSPEEYHYLFAQTSEEILQDSCPVEWVGSRIVTPLRENRGGIVPDRLTYLAAARNLPSRLLQQNWDQGAEWRDWFVTGLGVEPLPVLPPDDIAGRLDQHLQSLYQAEQAEVYQRVLLPNARNAEGDDVSLFDEISRVSTSKALLRMQMMLFYPASLFNSDQVRRGINGDAGLLDGRVLRRFREQDVPLLAVNRIARQRLEEFRRAWLMQPGAVRQQGSVSPSLAYAMTRMNILYRQFILSRSEPLQESEVVAGLQEQPEN